MRKKFTNLLLIPALFCLIVGSNSLKSQNLISNGGFEDGISKSWTLQVGGNAGATFQLGTTDAKEGQNYAKAVVTKVGKNAWELQLKNGAFAVTIDKTYRVSFWAKADVAGSKLNFNVIKSTSPYTYYASLTEVKLTTDWKEYVISLKSPVTTTNDITIAIDILSVATYSFDDCKVEETLISGATVKSTGKVIEIIYAEEFANPMLELQIPIIVKLGSGTIVPVESVSLLSYSNNTLIIKLKQTIPKGETVTITYYPGTLAKRTGYEIGAFSVTAVNQSVMKSATFVPEFNRISMNVYPNPVKQYLNIESEEQLKNVQILDLKGQRVLSNQSFNNQFVTLNLLNLKSGFYILQVTDSKGSIINRKFIKE